MQSWMNSFKNTGLTSHNEIMREKGRKKERETERQRDRETKRQRERAYLESSSTCSIRDRSISESIKLN